ncbi:hypothetical protein LCGC14_0534500 [marine sediment metagenome]|uniref:Uncharacterized protein n=1 Tax=marine sediment metagenome TaxID=412755 RepID=A0A0F9RZ58_9ZZZZ
MVVTGIVVIALAGILITLFSLTHTRQEPAILSSLGSLTLTNVTDFETFVSGASLANGTSKLIRSTPSFGCTSVHIAYNRSGTVTLSPMSLTVGGGIVVGETEVLCSQNGTIRFFLAGNSSNASGTGSFQDQTYNISYTAKRYDASWNVTKEIQGGLLVGGRNQATLYTLIILALIITLGFTMFGLSKTNIGDRIGGNGGGFKMGNPMDSFER